MEELKPVGQIIAEAREKKGISKNQLAELAGISHTEIARIESGTTLNSNTASPDNIICTIFGHDLSTTTVTVTHHKVEQHHPRCLMELYHVTACSRCNYTDAELQSSFHILCCPED